MDFIKMHGLGNDFVILDQRDGPEKISDVQVRYICNRNMGVGCDQLIIMEPSEEADLFMRIYNPDGGEAESCGNATRCVAHSYMKEQGIEECTIQTLGGLLSARMVNDLVEVDMGMPVSIQDMEPNLIDAYDPILVNVGNPHCVIFVNDAEEAPIEFLGPSIEKHEFFPDGTNVEFVHLQEDGSLRARVWERGAGITMACGSGACAVAAAAIHRGLVGDEVEIETDGGRLLMRHNKEDGHIFMTGPASYVFKGTLKSI